MHGSGGAGDFPEKLSHLLEYLLGKVDYQDHGAVVLAYGLYRESLKENYGIEDLLEFLASGEYQEEKNKRILETDLAEQPEENMFEIRRQEREVISHPSDQESQTIPSSFRKGFRYWKQIAAVVCLLAVTPVFVWGLMGMEFFIRYGVVIEIAEAVLAAAYLWRQKEGSEDDDKKTGNGQRKKKEPEEQMEEIPPWEMVFYEEPERKQEEIPRGRTVQTSLHAEQVDLEPQTVLLTESDRPPSKHVLSSQNPSQPDIPVPYYPFLIGKQTNLADYVLEHETISRLHVRIDETEDGYKITDLNSTNGTRVEGQLLEANETVPLLPGMEIEIADLRYRFM